ncbi:MAG: hypothetical protein WC071_08675 [Victivallaceae bacterium]
MEIILFIITQFINSFGIQYIPESAQQTVKFTQLPAECRQVYDLELRKMRQTDNTQVIKLDIDENGTDELIIFDGASGSGGEGWVIFTKSESGKYIEAGNVFGSLALYNNILIVDHHLGVCESIREYYQLENKKLVLKYSINLYHRLFWLEENLSFLKTFIQ